MTDKTVKGLFRDMLCSQKTTKVDVHKGKIVVKSLVSTNSSTAELR